MSASRGQIYEFGEWRLDAAERLLQRNGVPVPLTPKVFETLLLLVENAGKLVTKDEFMKRVWPDTFVEDLALVQNISQIRKVVNGHGPVIETVSKRGYRFATEVHKPEEATSSLASIKGQHDQNDWSNGAVLRKKSRTTRLIMLVAASLLLVAVAASWIVWERYRRAVVGAQSSPQPVLAPLLDLPGEERMPSLSPDGSRVAFVRQTAESGKTGIYVEVVGTQSLLQITSHANDSEPAWSPDGRNIAFLRTSGEQFSIELVPALGGTEKRLYTGSVIPVVGPLSLSFSPDGRELAFADWDNGKQTSSIKLISLADLGLRTLTSPPEGYHDCAPEFSPDGSRVAFVRSTGPMFVDDIFVVRSSGGTPARVTFDQRRVFSAPVWINNGREILFSSTRAGMKSMWRIPVADGQPVALAGSGPGSDHPAVSWSTHEVAYEHTIEDQNLWRVAINGVAQKPGAAVALLSPKTSNLMAQFSPDGTKIAFESDRSGYEEVWICDADGSHPVQLTKFERYSGSPNWSPDGRHIVFDYRSNLHSGIYVVDVESGTLRPVASFPDADNVVPSWSRDGQWIYFASNYGGTGFHVWKVLAAGGKPLQLTKDQGFKALDSEDGEYVYYTRLAEPGLWRVPRNGGPESLVAGAPRPDIWANWTVSANGVYFISSVTGQAPQLKFMDFKTGRTTTRATLTKPSFYGVTVAPDGNSAVYSQRDRSEHDIVLMTQFF